MTVREAMIVAGGTGSRLRPLTATTPKPLLPFCDAPFLLGVVARLADIGVRHVLLVVGRETAPFARLRTPAAELGVSIETVPEPEPLDTAGGVIRALDRVSATFLVLNGDILTDADPRPAIARHRSSGASATIMLTRVEDTSSFGVCVRDGSRVIGFVEKPPPGSLPGQDTVNAGTYVIEPDALAQFGPGPCSFEREVFPTLVEAGVHVEGVVDDGVWADLGTPERYLAGHRLALDGALEWPTLDRFRQAPGRVLVGTRVHRHTDAQVRGPVLLGDDVMIQQLCRIGPHTVLGAGVTVGPGSVVERSVVAAGARVGSQVELVETIVGSGAVIGNRVRAEAGVIVGEGQAVPDGTVLASGVRVPSSVD